MLKEKFKETILSTVFFLLASCSSNQGSQSTLLADGILSGHQVTLPFDNAAINRMKSCLYPNVSNCEWTMPAASTQWWSFSVVANAPGENPVPTIHGVNEDRTKLTSDKGNYITAGSNNVISLQGVYKILKPTDLRIYDGTKISINVTTSVAYVPNGGATAFQLLLACDVECKIWERDECLDVIRPGFYKSEEKNLPKRSGGWGREHLSLMVDDIDLGMCGEDLKVSVHGQAKEIQIFPLKIQILSNL